jgi:hypothetical protein
MARDRQVVDGERPDVDVELAECLDRIRVEQRSLGLRLAHEGWDVLHRSHLVVHPHDRAAGHRVVELFRDARREHLAIGVDVEEALLTPLFRNLMHRRQHGLVLDGRGQHRSPLRLECAPAPQHREVIRLRAA